MTGSHRTILPGLSPKALFSRIGKPMREVTLLSMVVFLSLLPGLAVAAPAAQLWVIWNDSQESNTTAIDHSGWQEFLSAYVVRGPNDVDLVAYGRVSAEDRLQLQSYLRGLSRLDPRDYARWEQLAYWLNLYNALTVELVLSAPGKDSIMRMGRGWFSAGPWDDEVITVAGQALTLNDIEHRIVRPLFKDRRAHYALNCASLGCPDLGTQAYTSANLEGLLAANEIAYINHRRGVHFDARGRLVVSQIYQWYQADFPGQPRDFLHYLSERHAVLGDELRSYRGRIDFDYDWSLNLLSPPSSPESSPESSLH
jgi:hypothetical protein